MSRRPPIHQGRSHQAILGKLANHARIAFPDHTVPAAHRPPGWDPTLDGRTTPGDLGRGVLDVAALALHVLWTYQEAWTDEGFLSLAHLQSSVDKLLAQIAYRPAPALAAQGLQHFTVAAGESGILPAGFAVRSAARGGRPAVTYETSAPLSFSDRINGVRAFRVTEATSDLSATPDPDSDTSVGIPPALPTVPVSNGTVADQLAQRLRAGQGDLLAARRIARARARAHQLRALVAELKEQGAAGCEDALAGLCEELCAAQAAAGESVPVGPPTASQSLAARQLSALGKRQPDALAALEEALARCACETPEEHRKRVAAMARFLDAFVAGMLQEARDQIVLLRGPQTLATLDRRLRGPRASRLGVAPPGTDTLHLVDVRDGALVPGTFPEVRVGHWFVLEEERTRTDAEGRSRSQRVATEAIQVVEVGRDVLDGVGSPLTRIVFRPPLTRRYRLDDLTLLGNCVPISAGQTESEPLSLERDGVTHVLRKEPVTWLADVASPGGRRAEVEVRSGPRIWHPVSDLLAAGADDHVFAVEPLPGGGARVRFGDGIEGALPADEAEIVYRVGAGPETDAAAGTISEIAGHHASLSATRNPLRVRGAAAAEDPARARVLGPFSLRALDRAASAEDLVALAVSRPHVDRAAVAAGQRRGEVGLVISGGEDMRVHPDDVAALATFLSARIPPGIALTLLPTRPVPLRLSATLHLVPGADPVTVQTEVEHRLGLRPGEGTDGLLALRNTDLGQVVTLSRVYDAVRDVPDLEWIVISGFDRRSSGPLSLEDRIVCAADERPCWALGDTLAQVRLGFQEAVNHEP